MKTLISIFAVTLALAFAGPTFAQDVKTAKTAADCAKAGGVLGCRYQHVLREEDVIPPSLRMVTKGRWLRSAPFAL